MLQHYHLCYTEYSHKDGNEFGSKLRAMCEKLVAADNDIIFRQLISLQEVSPLVKVLLIKMLPR